jgi:hypothetical protein
MTYTLNLPNKNSGRVKLMTKVENYSRHVPSKNEAGQQIMITISTDKLLALSFKSSDGGSDLFATC